MYVKELLVPHVKLKIPCKNSIVTPTSAYTYVPDLGHPGGQGPHLPYKVISRVWHHLSPF